ncbi:MAG TPA: hypothetical protein VNB22_19015 [Pyrinomonadaceae bacterium]|nr:hypothetical protein [Pyrinomonadaceae bacterium]
MSEDPKPEKKSFVKLTQLPEKFWEVLIVFAFIILISPFLSGMDFGVIKTPKFSPYLSAILFPIASCIFVLTALAFYPFYGKSRDNNLYWTITIVLFILLLTELLVFYFYPTINIEKIELDHVSEHGVAHINIVGNSRKLFSNDFKIFVFTRVIEHGNEWWHDTDADTDFNPTAKNWKAEAIAGDDSENRRICSATEVEIIAIGSTDEEMNKEFANNKNAEHHIKYIDKFMINSGIAKTVIEPPSLPKNCKE